MYISRLSLYIFRLKIENCIKCHEVLYASFIKTNHLQQIIFKAILQTKILFPFSLKNNIFASVSENDMSYNQNDIISGINHKDKKAWNMVYSQFYAALCAYVAKMIPESEAVEDLV